MNSNSTPCGLSGTAQARRAWTLLSAFFLTLMFCTGHSFGQADQGALTGVVEDASGAVIPNAQVTLINTDTDLRLTGQTDASGNYVFSPIKIGNYKVVATSAGFGTTTQDNIQIHVQDRIEVNLKLNAGGNSVNVEVTSAPPLLQTESGSTGQVIASQAINDTPLNGRNWVFIAQLTAGVAPSNGGAARRAATSTRMVSAPSRITTSWTGWTTM